MSVGESWRRLLFYLRRRRLAEDLNEEMRLHIELRASRCREGGLEPRDAANSARRRFGNPTLFAEASREAWGWRPLDELARNIRYASRALRKTPAFSLIAILSLALGIAANTAVFSFVHAIVYRTLPVSGAARLVILRQQNQTFHIENCCFPYPFFREIRKQDNGFEDLLALNSTDLNLADAGQTERVSAEIVSGNYFEMLGVHPAAGRLLNLGDDRSEGAGRVCVISYRLWQERYGGSPDAIGRRVLLNDEPFQIVGVSEQGFTGASLHDPRDLQVPASVRRIFLGDSRDILGWAELIARLKPGDSRKEAEIRLNVTGKQVERVTGPKMSDHDAFVLRDGSQGVDSRKEQLARPLLILFLLVAVVLLIACANVAALLLVRVVERTREAGLRLALGASPATVFRQFLVETLLLASLAGAAGWVLSRQLILLLLGLLGSGTGALAQQLRPDSAVFGFSLAITFAAGILFGLLPAWRASRVDPLRSIQGASAAPGTRLMASRILIAGQMALSLVLLFSAALFSRTLHNLRSIDLGFRAENLVLLHIDLSRTAYANGGSRQYFEELLRRARELGDTRAASLAGLSVLSGSMQSASVQVPGYVSPNRLLPVSYFNGVSSGYFRTLGLPLLAGRDFDRNDHGTGEAAVIVNEQFARQFFRGDALGKTFQFGGSGKARVIGIAGNTKFRYLREEPNPVFYMLVSQGHFPDSLYLQVRTNGDTSQTIERLRSVVAQMDARVPVDSLTTMQMQIDQALGRERMISFLSGLLGVMVVALAMVGLYGVLASSVARRTREIGIRLALGAGRGRVISIVLRESAWIVGAGVALGLPLALVCGRLASSLLYGLKPEDPATAIMSTLLLALVALAAALIPAYRAARLNALDALRYE